MVAVSKHSYPDLHISASALRTLMSCEREFFLKYVEGLSPASTPSAIVVGSAIHVALAAFYQALAQGQHLELDELVSVAAREIRSRMDLEPPILFEAGENAQSLVDRSKALLQAFVRSPFVPARILGVEVPFELNPAHPETGEIFPFQEKLVGAIDLIGENEAGDIMVVDHKTASRSVGDRTKRPDMQMAVYSVAAKELTGSKDVNLAYQALIATRTPKVEVLKIDRVEHDEAEAMETVIGALARINVMVSHPHGKRMAMRQRSWRCHRCGYFRKCAEDRL